MLHIPREMMKNIRIRSKLIIGFALVLAITAIIAIYGGNRILHVDNEYTYAMSFPSERLDILHALSRELVDSRRLLNRAVMYIFDPDIMYERLYRREAALENSRNTIDGLIAMFANNLREDPRLLAEEVRVREDALRAYEAAVHRYFDHYVVQVFYYIRALDGRAARATADNLSSQIAVATRYYRALMDTAQEFMANIGDELSDVTMSTLYLLIAFAVAGVLLGVLVAFLISGSITKPIGKVLTTLRDVSKGNLNINIDRANISKDETGMLTQDICALVDIIRSVVDDLAKFEHAYNVDGDIEYRIDIEKYQNSFKEMANGSNRLMDTVVSDVLGFLDTLAKVNDGNFNPEIKKLPGKRVAMEQAIKSTTANMIAINSEINAMIESIASKGDLSFQIDANSYKGDWSKIMAGLNTISAAVYEPLKVIAIAMDEMQIGNFDLGNIDGKITAQGFNADATNYSGMFRDIISNFDSTISAISSYIDEITKVLGAISDGNLTTKITRDYLGDFGAIKASLNNISSTLHKTMSEISVASEQVLSGANQISISAQELASGAQEQASSVEQLNAAIDIIGQQTQQNAESAIEASEISKKSTANATEGNASMKEMLAAMSQIKESSGEISKIIKAIQDIAFQTNLLALNASVEAARAGEHGKGFSVVADEVRNLAGRSQDSASETTELIATSNSRVENGADIAEATSKSLDMIVKNAAEVSALISNISAASKEQAESISQIGDGLSQISKVTQSNSAVSEETAAASQELNSQAELLRELVAYFKL
ncbi:MAG: methyl-accepting chemotaxis protein [Defluviitaleaceae bacterium]|nr:methyl-accepting chemotaxis protein [Defluviitaleaceae bacterium]